MQYRNLNGENISLLGFGAMRLDLTPDGTKKSEEIVDYSIAHGVNYFDTAYVYLGGKSEEFLGRVLSKYNRKSYNIATKIPPSAIKAEGDLEKYFSVQLKRLKTDYIDYFLIHNINSRNFHMLEKIKCMNSCLKKRKMDRYVIWGFRFTIPLHSCVRL